MFSYRLYGLRVRSAVPLPMLRETEFEGKADVTVRRSWFPRPRRFFYRGDRRFKRKNGVGFALLRNGKSLLLDIRCAETDGALCMFLYGTCFPALMRQRGYSHYLHGSCLEKNGRAVLISGESGAGKSTLAAELLEHGWRFMADDVTFFSVEENSVLMVPSCPIQKLWDDAVEALPNQNRERLIMSSVDGRVKYYVSVPESYSTVPAKLGMIVNLSRGEDFRFEMLSEEEKMSAILADLMPSPKKGSPEAAPAGRIAAYAAVCRSVRTETRADCANIRERIEGMLA